MYNFRLNGRDFHFRVIDLTQWKLPPNCGRPIVFLRTRPTSPFRHQHRCREKAVFIFIAPCVLIMTGIGGRLISMMMILLLYSRIIISNTSRHDAAIISSLVPVVLFLPPFVFRHDHACDDPLDASIPTHERENFLPFFDGPYSGHYGTMRHNNKTDEGSDEDASQSTRTDEALNSWQKASRLALHCCWGEQQPSWRRDFSSPSWLSTSWAEHIYI